MIQCIMKEVMQLVWTWIWSWFGGGWSGIKRKKKWQKGVEKPCFSISHEHAKNSHRRAKWTRRGFWLQLKRRSENWLRMTMQNFHTVMRNAPRRQNSCWCILHFTQSYELVRARAKLYFLQIPWWRSLWKTS